MKFWAAVACFVVALGGGVILGTYLISPKVAHRAVFRASAPCPPLVLPELRPSSGLVWSKRHHTQQYDPSNVATTRFVGIDDVENERFLDIAGRAYSREFCSRFSYGHVPDLRVEYLRRAETFVGKVIGRGLKPNFAYQLKLSGLYSDRQAFERIGYLGRWRLPGLGTNYSDADFRAYQRKDLVQSYLLFDFAITDPHGNIAKEFYADSSLHVLWSATWQRFPGANDTFPQEVSREGSDPASYSNPHQEFSSEKVFAESEAPRRPPVGLAFLPAGRYAAELVLTEESFHGYSDAGYWATVMRAPVEFEIVEMPRPSPYWKLGVPVAALSLKDASARNLSEQTCTADSLEGFSYNNDPQIRFAEQLELPAGERYFLTAEIYVSNPHVWEIFVDSGRGFAKDRDGFEQPDYRVRSDGCRGWRRFEIEITSHVAGKKCRLRLDPDTAAGNIKVRNVAIRKVSD